MKKDVNYARCWQYRNEALTEANHEILHMVKMLRSYKKVA
jgi:hypothetical protein